MDEMFIRNRISELRLKKGISEYRMSTDMGHSKSYIQSITSGRAMPSLSEFLYMCQYLGITPRDFFDQNLSNPAKLNQVTGALQMLSDDDLSLILSLIERLQ